MLPDKRNPENVPDPYGLRRQSAAAMALWIRVLVSERNPKRGRSFVLCPRIPKHKCLCSSVESHSRQQRQKTKYENNQVHAIRQ
jgi:hypothetical protein